MELMFAELSGSAYAGLACIPESITDTSGKSQDITGLWSLSQPISLSPVSSRSNSAASSPRKGRSSSRSPIDSPRRERSRSRDRNTEIVSFTPRTTERRNIADERYRLHVTRGDYRDRRGDGWGIINKTKKERKTRKERERKTRKEREKKKRTRRRKPRRSTNSFH
jgi:hypothetical protein